MNEIKQVCERVLADAPAPPRRDVDQVLAQARRADRRASRRNAVASGLAVAAVVTATALAWPQPSAPPSQPAAPTMLSPVTLAPPPPVPTPDAADAHGAQIYQALAAAVPPGLTAAPATDIGAVYPDTMTWVFPDPVEYSSETGVIVSSGSQAGTLSAMFVSDKEAAPTGELCTAAIRTRLARFADPSGPCRTVTIGGVAVRVSTPVDGGSAVATRFLEGGYLSIRASRRASPSDDLNSAWYLGSIVDSPPLTAPVPTADRLAALAADPALLP